jgi:hypothetical protein
MSEQSIASEPIPQPYFVLDAILARGMNGLNNLTIPLPVRYQRRQISSGSMRYELSVRSRPVGWFDVTAIAAAVSLFEVTVVPELQSQQSIRYLLTMLSSMYLDVFKASTTQALRIEAIIKNSIADLEELLPTDAGTDNSARRGPRPLKINEWARQEHAAGKTIDELLPEYARRRKLKDLADARELLRKAVNPPKRKLRPE